MVLARSPSTPSVATIPSPAGNWCEIAAALVNVTFLPVTAMEAAVSTPTGPLLVNLRRLRTVKLLVEKPADGCVNWTGELFGSI